MRLPAGEQGEIATGIVPPQQMVMLMNLMSDILRHKTEFARALRNGQVEVAPNGLYFHASKILLGGVFRYSIDNDPMRIAHNTATFEGLNDVLSVYFAQGSQRTAFYFIPYANNVTPDETVTAANFNATLGEFLNYTATQRQVWTPGAVASQSMDNTASPAQLVIGTGGGTVYGAGLVTAQAKSATTGVCPVVAAFTDGAAVLNAGSKLNLEYTLAATAT